MSRAEKFLRLTAVEGTTGWVTPQGKLVTVVAGGHLEAAMALGESHPDNKGWVHVAGGVADPISVPPTRQQTNKLLDLVAEGSIKLPLWLAGWGE